MSMQGLCQYRNKIIHCKNGKELSKELSCDDVGINCLLRKCDNCKDKVIHFQEFVGTMHVWYDTWGTQDVKYKDRHGAIKKSKHTVKLRCKMSAYKLINSLEGTMEKYMAHQAIIRNQYCALKFLKLTISRLQLLTNLLNFSETQSALNGLEPVEDNFPLFQALSLLSILSKQSHQHHILPSSFYRILDMSTEAPPALASSSNTAPRPPPTGLNLPYLTPQRSLTLSRGDPDYYTVDVPLQVATYFPQQSTGNLVN